MQFQFFENLRERLNDKNRVSSRDSEGSNKTLPMTLRKTERVLSSRVTSVLENEKCLTQVICSIEQTLQQNCSSHRVLWVAALLKAPVWNAQRIVENVCEAPAAMLTNRKTTCDMANTNRAASIPTQEKGSIVTSADCGEHGNGGDSEEDIWELVEIIPMIKEYKPRQLLPPCMA